jgi:hypothetical protein
MEPLMRICVSSLALGLGLLTEAALALGQPFSSTVVAQAVGAEHPSGVLITPPPAPVAVPPSGVLPTIEHRGFVTLPFRWSQKIQTAKTAAPVTLRRHVAHSRRAGRKTIAQITTVRQSIAATAHVDSAPAEQPGQDETGYELLLAQLGKGKVSK